MYTGGIFENHELPPCKNGANRNKNFRKYIWRKKMLQKYGSVFVLNYIGCTYFADLNHFEKNAFVKKVNIEMLCH